MDSQGIGGVIFRLRRERGADPAAAGGAAPRNGQGGEQMGAGSFP